MALFGSLGKEKKNLFTGVDIGSDSIKAIVFDAGSGGYSPGGAGKEEGGGGDVSVPAPKFSKKHIIKIIHSRDQNIVIAKFRELIFSIVKELGRMPERNVVAFGPNFAEHTIVSWSIRPSGSGGISRRELGAYFGQLLEERRDRNRYVIAYPLSLLANGYPANAEMLSRETPAEFTFEVLLLYLSRETGQMLSDFAQIFRGLEIQFVPMAAVYAQGIRRIFKKESFFLVDVGGYETTLTFLHDGVIRQIRSFPLGSSHYVKGIMELTDASPEEAEDIKKQYTEGIVGERTKSRLRDFFTKGSELWKKMFLKELEWFYPLGPIPPDIFLCGGGVHLPEITGILRGRDWLKDTSWVTAPEVRILSGESYFHGNTLKGVLQGPEDAGIASFIVYILSHKPLW
jgi:hypothetical protein